MKLPKELQKYHDPLVSLQNLISRSRYRGVVIGGLAASVLGEAKYPYLDLSRIEYWVKSFAELMEMPELWGQTEKILKQQE